MTVLRLLVVAVTLVHVISGQKRIVSYTGQSGPTCVTSSNFLGNCVSASSCSIDGATSGSCLGSTVCCLRVSSTSSVQTSHTPQQRPVALPTQRPEVVVRPTRANVISSPAGQAGPTCVTSSGFLGDCVSASNCNIGGATSGRCPGSTVCCLRVSITSSVKTSFIQSQKHVTLPTQRPEVVVRPTQPQRRLCTYRRPVTSSPPNLSLLARSGRGRRSPQRSRLNRVRSKLRPNLNGGGFSVQGGGVGGLVSRFIRDRVKSGSNPTGSSPAASQSRPAAGGIPVQSPASGLLFSTQPGSPTGSSPGPSQLAPVAGGIPVQSPASGLLSITQPGSPHVNLDTVLSNLDRSPVTRRPVITPSRPTVTRYETYVAYC